ncbi:hypothetical protein BU15DRAFT_40061 [Melanogaster broomeanus]|nr:hypothetical protein BU15DRAFT_40061 [Melanogaster broomeanus]
MAVPSSSHHDRDREREREREREHRRERHHHHRTISSTTLLLVLSLVLAVLAVMLSLPASQGAAAAAGKEDPAATGIWGYLNPKRSQVLVTRERDVAMREAEVARREAELLVGAPGGVLPTQSPVACPVCTTQTFIDIPPVQTIIKEVVKEQELAPPGWWKEASNRADEILDRELRVADREREITRREESVNKREHDASRREGWIMEQLVLINSESAVEEEVYYEQPGPKRKFKELPPMVIAETETKTIIQYETLPAQTVTVPPPASTRRAAFPTPDVVSSSFSTAIPRTTAITYEEEIIKEPLHLEEIEEYEVEEYQDDDGPRVAVRRNARRPPPPRSGWLW